MLLTPATPLDTQEQQMKEVIAFYAAAKKGGMTTCAAIRATVIQLVDVPRTERWFMDMTTTTTKRLQV